MKYGNYNEYLKSRNQVGNYSKIDKRKLIVLIILSIVICSILYSEKSDKNLKHNRNSAVDVFQFIT